MDMQPVIRQSRSEIFGLWRRRVPLDADVLARMGQARVYLKQGQTDRARAAVDALQPLAPLDPRLLQLRAECALACDAYSDAVSLFERALTQSDQATLWAGKGAALRALNRQRQAAACFQRARALCPEETHYHRRAAECLLTAGQPQDALDELSVNSANAETLRLLAIVQFEMGLEKASFESALKSAQKDSSGKSLRLARRLAKTPHDIAEINKICAPLVSNSAAPAQVLAASISPDRPDLAQRTLAEIEAKVTQPTTPIDQKAAFHHVIFRHYDFIDAREIAQQHLVQFHKFQRINTPYRRSQDSALFTVLKRLRFTALPPSKSSVLPIFVTGLPGSGRSYACELLQSSAKPATARPLHLIEAVMNRFMRQLRQSGSRDVSRDDLMALQSELRSGLLQAANGSEIVIDSAMLNFRWSGLIHAALPEARIVHIKSDKMQTGWAMYAGSHDNNNLGCTHDLNDLRAYQAHSRQLMQHWEELSGGSIVSVSGDALLRSSGQSARAMVEVCQLKWSRNCTSAPTARRSDWYRYADLLAPLHDMPDTKDANTPM